MRPGLRWLSLLTVAATIALSLTFSLAGVAVAATATATNILNPDAYTCGQTGYINFEALPNGANLSAGAINGVQFTTTGGFTWLVGDFATNQYNGKYPNGAYTSEGTHWAWLGPNQGTGRIDFVNGPASVFSLLTSVGASPVVVAAYAADNTLLVTTPPAPGNIGTGRMTELKITRDTADIAYVIVHDSGNFFLIDAVCTDAPGVPNAVNAPPVLTRANAAVTVNEGQTATNSGTVSDADGDTVALTASVGTVVNNGDGTWSWSYATTDGPDQSQTVTITGGDGKGGTAEVSFALTVANVAPTLSAITAPVAPVAVNTAIATSASFTDPGSSDTHTATWDWGDGTTSAGTINAGAVSGNHTYAAAGVYTVSLTVEDDDGGADTEVFQYVVVYDPSAGFVTGGGWIDSPVGAYAADPTMAGKASFGFVSKYQKGATVPTGQTQFQFHAAGLSFHSTAYQWLVISGPKAQYKGSGTINGQGDYGFILTANDGQVNGGGGVDRFRLKIWDKTTGDVVYDNQIGAADDTAASDAIEGGSIVIHSK